VEKFEDLKMLMRTT